jgi:thiamine pyrophosphokinase
VDIDRPPDIVVIAGGARVEPGQIPAIAGAGRVVAADAGVAEARRLGLAVDVAVGDFDSLPPDDVARLHEMATEVRRHPADKDATDLELALGVAAETAPARVLLIGIEGGRPDHALANLMLAASSRFASVELEMSLAGGRAWVVRDHLCGSLPPASLVSVVPVHGEAVVSQSGVRWPLDRRTLEAGTTLAVSNRVTGSGPYRLDVHAGVAICIAPRDIPEIEVNP